MKKLTYILSLCTVLALCGCAPVNRLTRLKKLPREYSENYAIEGVKAPKTEAHKRPWIVYSDRNGNAAYAHPGGKVEATRVEYLEPFLVISTKGDYLELIKYKSDNIKNDKLTQRKKAEYVGWMHASRLLLSPSSVTDIRSGLKDKMLTAIRDSSAVLHPERYFARADSLKVYDSPQDKEPVSSVGLHEIVYVLKRSDDTGRVLVSRTPELSVDGITAEVVGWIPRNVLQNAGRQLFTATPWSGEYPQPQSLRYSPVLYPIPTDNGHSFTSGVFAPVIDRSGNRVYNIDGEAISYARSKEIERSLSRLNVVFAIEPCSSAATQYPMLLNVIQNLRSVFAADSTAFACRFGAAAAVAGGVATYPLSADYADMTDMLTRRASQIETATENTPQPWSTLRAGLDLFGDDPSAANLVIVVGEQGGAQETAPEDIVRALQRLNCRVLGLQLQAKQSDSYHNFVLQLTDMIERYAAHQSRQKRKITVFADQYRRENRFREVDENFYLLDWPGAAITQGGVLFPAIGQMFQLEKFSAAMDSLVTQIYADNRLMSRSIDRAFATVGNDRDCYDERLVQAFGLQPDDKPTEEFRKMFYGQSPLWYRTVPRTTVPDSLMQYRLLLSAAERKQLEDRLESLCSMPVDVKDNSKPKKGRLRSLCRYLAETEDLPDVADTGIASSQEVPRDTVYLSTRKVRKHLQRFYLSELKSCRVCHPSNRELKRLTLAEAHCRIFGVPSNDPSLDGITVGSLRKHHRFSDRELEQLVAGFMGSKSRFSEKAADEQFSSVGQQYYYLDPKLLP